MVINLAFFITLFPFFMTRLRIFHDALPARILIFQVVRLASSEEPYKYAATMTSIGSMRHCCVYAEATDPSIV